MDKLIKNKRITNYILKQKQPYWTRYKFGSKWYILTFEFLLYETVSPNY